MFFCPSRQGAGADEFLLVVEGQWGLGGQAAVGLPVLDEGLGLADLALPLLDGPVADPAVRAAEVPVEVGADLVAVLPGGAQLAQCALDPLGVVEADVRAPGGVLRRAVLLGLALRQQIDAAEEVRHLRVVLLAHLAEVGEELLAVLAGAVPGEHHELRRLLTGLQALRLEGSGLGAGVRRRAVTDEPYRVLGRSLLGSVGTPSALVLAFGSGEPDPEHPASPTASAVTAAPQAILFVAASIRPPLPSGSVR